MKLQDYDRVECMVRHENRSFNLVLVETSATSPGSGRQSFSWLVTSMTVSLVLAGRHVRIGVGGFRVWGVYRVQGL